MYMRAVTFRIVYLGIMSAGILLSSFLRDSTVQAAPVTSAAAATVVAPAAPHIVTLQTVHVSAAARHVAARAPALAKAAHAAGGVPEAGDEHTGTTLPTLRLDMPYYAFGKLLPRVGKE